MKHRLLVVEGSEGLRLDQYLAKQEFVPSRSRATELIDAGLVTEDGRALKASFRVRLHMQIDVEMPPPVSMVLEPLDGPLDILYQDSDVAVINKPAGLVVHPAAGHAQDTLVNLLLHHLDHLSMGFGEQRPGIVHRLDRDTSGVLVVAKNDSAHVSLSEQFRAKTARRHYWALVNGVPSLEKATLTTHLARHKQDRKRFASTTAKVGKLAITHYTRLGFKGEVSWLECRLETGRTHQIRVHMCEAGWPIVGDPIYGRKRVTKADRELNRLGLHAFELGFTHPRSGERLNFRVDWPESMRDFVKARGFGL